MHPRWETKRNNGLNANRNRQTFAGKGMGRTSNGMVKRRFGLVDLICLCLSQSHFIYVDTAGLYVDPLVNFMLTHFVWDEEYNSNC